MRFYFKTPVGVDRNKSFDGGGMDEVTCELRELRAWLYALTEQLEYVIGREEVKLVGNDNKKKIG